MNKCYSINGEEFSFHSLEEAASNFWEFHLLIREIGFEATLWEADSDKPLASELLPNIADTLLDQASDKYGEWADIWEFTKDQERSLQERLQAALDEWATENDAHPTFWKVIDAKTVNIRFTSMEGKFEIITPEIYEPRR